ncbi:diflavin flavoprotein [Prochlorococcus sp. MIT 1307]|uniref:diflavin flavoprotein n=1 Tax=Prochlorococcus sp. MIT 1307 TaxID=3096219 RepID=UPI002A755A9B|nr:diflavin flavoprotein [Prochlorococcus sp. MIT 1307]
MKSPIRQESDNQADMLQLVSIPIEEGLVSLRGLSPKRLRFELEYGLERGSTDNSFLFTSDKKSKTDHQIAILVHPPGAIYSQVFLPALANALKDNNSQLKVIVGHVNPNRVKLLKQLKEIYPNLQLISSNPAAKLLKELWNQRKPIPPGKQQENDSLGPPFPILHIVRQEETININHNYQLKLIPAPTPHWPGGLLAFEEQLGLLMSDKLFAAHICTPKWEESNRSSTEEERRHFYDCLMAPMQNQVTSIVDRLEELDIKSIAPGHGPTIETSWRSLLNDYRRWGEGQQQASIKVILLFASAYGNTAAIADALANGIAKTGVRVESLNCEFISPEELNQAIQEADAYLIGSPTLGGHAPTPIVSALGALLAEGDREKPVGIFGSYGWSGEALDLLENKLRNGGFKFGFAPIKIKFSPDTAMVKTLEETGSLFGRGLLNTQKRQQRRATGGMTTSRSDPAILALGRIVGSLSVLTTRKGHKEEQLSGAMVASWVSQASFNPPGLSIAVAKDRAVGSLLHSGDIFTLNVLAQGRHTSIMKKFLQPFPPGADRFADINVENSPQGQPILPDALAWLEGSVKQRMECGDHWLIYAEITNGKVIDLQGITAVHQRRSGANY